MSGQAVARATITDVSNGNPCIVTTDGDHGFPSLSFVRITDLGVVHNDLGDIRIDRGMDPINDRRFRIIVTATDAFKIQDPITYEDIDSTDYTPYLEGGSCNLVQTEFIYEA